MKSSTFKIVAVFFLLSASAAVFGQPEWKLYGDMPFPVSSGEAVTLNGKIYILGGSSDSTGAPTKIIQEFDPEARAGDQWHVVGRMLTPRSNFVARAYKDIIIISGGETGFDQLNANAMEIWSPLKGSTLLDEDSRTNRIGATGEIWNNIFIIIGGFYRSAVDVSFNAIVAFDVFERREGFSIPLPITLIPYNHASFLLKDTIFIAGGVRAGVSKRIYEFSITGGGIGRIKPDLKQPRASFEAVVESPTSAWFIGGYNEENRTLATTSIFSVTSFGYQLQPASDLVIGRRELMAARLGDAIYVFGGRNDHNEVVKSVEKLTLPAETGVEEKVVNSFLLKQNYPNPFNPSTTIVFELPVLEYARLDVFSANGVHVKTLINEDLFPGEHSVIWDGTDANGNFASSGVYLYKLTTESSVETHKMLLVK